MPEPPSRSPVVNHIRAERPEDSLAIEEVVRQAFGQEDEATLVRALRDGGFNLLSLVALRDDQIVGHLLFTRLPIVGVDRGRESLAKQVSPSSKVDTRQRLPTPPVETTRTWNAVALAPLAVSPAFQRTGVGTALMQEGLRQLKALGETIVVVLGHAHYYARFGFSPELAKPLLSPYAGPSWMALELQPGVLEGVSGRVKYAPPFGC